MPFLGTVLMVMGTAIRVQCFREMGIHFTFSPSIVYRPLCQIDETSHFDTNRIRLYVLLNVYSQALTDAPTKGHILAIMIQRIQAKREKKLKGLCIHSVGNEKVSMRIR